MSNHPACFGASSADASQSISATTFTQAVAISQNISARISGARQLGGAPLASKATTGLAAGSAPQQWNVWGSLSNSNTDTNYTNAVGNRMAGNNDVTNTILGVDYALNPSMIVGLSIALDNGDNWSQNITGAGAKLPSAVDGYVLAPYIGYQLSKEWALDASVGLGQGDYSASGGVKADIDRWFAAANATYARWSGNWQYTGKASFLHGEEKYGDLRSAAATVSGSTNKVDQIRLGAQAGYWMNGGMMPYAGIGYTSNVNRSGGAANDPTGRDAFVATLGINFFSLSSKITGGVMYEQELSRSNSDNEILSANLNVRF